MNTISYAAAHANFSSTMDEVCNDHVPILITRENKSPIVMISLEDYESADATSYLLRSPANARQLFESIAELEAGYGVEKELIE